MRVYILLIEYFLFELIWISISLLCGLSVRSDCIPQTDLKSLIAWSSVAHIGTVSCIVNLVYWGVCGSHALVISCALCSSCLLCLANTNMNFEDVVVY